MWLIYQKKEKVMNKIFKLFLITFAIACAISMLVAMTGWLAKWNSPSQFSNGFFWVGAIIVTLGTLSVMGGYTMRSDFGVIYSQSAGDMNTLERSQRWIADTLQGYNTFTLLLLVGLYLIGFSILIPNIF